MEQSGTMRNAAAGGARPDGGEAFFSSYPKGSAKRSLGGIGGNPPLGGGFSPDPLTTDMGKRVAAESPERKEAALWLQTNLPTVAAVAASFRAEFGDVRLVWAREGVHEVGRAS